MEIDHRGNAEPDFDPRREQADPIGGRGMTPQSVGAQLRSLSTIIVVVGVGTFLVAVTVLIVGRVAGQSAGELVDDIYEISGSRLTGILTMVGVMMLVATSAICLFTAHMAWAEPGRRPWARFLLGAGMVTAVLAIDDYFSIHEFPGEVLSRAIGASADWAFKNILEAGVLGLYVLLMAALLWTCRSLVASTDWTLLGIAAAFFLIMFAIDMTPWSWVAEPLGIVPSRWGFVEDTIKLIGISFFATYWVRTSAGVIRAKAA